MSHSTKRSKSRLSVAAAYRLGGTALAGALIAGALLLPAPASAAPDPDQDGLPTSDEVAIGTDPYRYDTDMDGLSDFQEVTQFSTDPKKADTDEDGVNDGTERDRKTDPRVSDLPRPEQPPAQPAEDDFGPEAGPPGTRSVRVNADVDVYDIPGGEGKIIDVIDVPEGNLQRFIFMYRCREDNWCEIAWGTGPNGRAWVWGAFLDK